MARTTSTETTPRLGARVRAFRKKAALTQVELARQLGISASYLNLIEHDQRALTAPLLLRAAHVFQLDLLAFASPGEGRLAVDLAEVFADPLFTGSDVNESDLRELAGSAPLARAFLKLYRSYRETGETAGALAARLSESGDLYAVDPARLPSEEVSDLIQEHRNHFPALEEAAERLASEARLASGDLYGGLVRYLAEAHGARVRVTPADEGPALRRFDPASGLLSLSEVLPPRSRNFQLAHQIGLLRCREEIDRIAGASTSLSTPDSRSLGRVALANYFAGALLMPYGPFREAAASMRYDIELLGHRFRTSFEQVCHRLTTLQRPGAEGVPFHLVRVDIAGNISKRFSASGIRFARYSGSCPRWNVHAAFMTPGHIRTQLSRMPDGTGYFCVARTLRKSRGGYGGSTSLLAIGLGCRVEHARELVYADGVDLSGSAVAVPIGLSCRLCERKDCEQRAFPPIQHRLSIDENVRARSFYFPLTAGGPSGG